MNQLPEAHSEKSTDKFRELIIYIATKCEFDRSFGSTKLNKLLFFADFFWYRETGHSITGEEYQKLNHGPCARRMVPVLKELVLLGAVDIREAWFFNKNQQRVVPRRSAELALFTGKEIAFVDALIDASLDRTAKELSEFSHQFIGWKLAKMGETIPYEAALIATNKPTEQEIAYGKTLEGMAKECLAR